MPADQKDDKNHDGLDSRYLVGFSDDILRAASPKGCSDQPLLVIVTGHRTSSYVTRSSRMGSCSDR